jgi:hypothetical protein
MDTYAGLHDRVYPALVLNEYSVQALFEEGALSTLSSAQKKQLFDSMIQVHAHVVHSREKKVEEFRNLL